MSRSRSLLLPALALVFPLTACAAGSTTSAPTDAASQAGSVSSKPASPDRVPLRRVKQNARLTMLPQISDPGRKTRSAAKAKSAMSGKFKPGKAGRPVLVQRKKGKGWATVSRTKQNGRGVVEVSAPYKFKGKAATYRLKALRYNGLAPKSSNAESTNAFKADFTDQFEGKTLDLSVWDYPTTGYQPTSSRTCSKVHRSAVKLGGGAVRIAVKDDPTRPSATDKLTGNQRCKVEGGKYHWRYNGSIGTEGAREFTYGHFASRVKFQKPRGQHAAFWTYAGNNHEIDIIEWFGKNHPEGGMTSFVYNNGEKYAPGCPPTPTPGCAYLKKPAQYGGKWWKKYHVFSVEWTPKRYVFRIDGQETGRITRAGAKSSAPVNIKLSLLASDYELKNFDGDKAADAEGAAALKKLRHTTMSVDWVRHWTR